MCQRAGQPGGNTCRSQRSHPRILRTHADQSSCHRPAAPPARGPRQVRSWALQQAACKLTQRSAGSVWRTPVVSNGSGTHSMTPFSPSAGRGPPGARIRAVLQGAPVREGRARRPAQALRRRNAEPRAAETLRSLHYPARTAAAAPPWGLQAPMQLGEPSRQLAPPAMGRQRPHCRPLCLRGRNRYAGNG